MSEGKRKNEKGFTLIEIMIVIGIIAMLFGLVGPRVMDALKGSKEKVAAIQIKSYEQALQSYYLAHSRYPTTAQGGLNALLTKPTIEPIPENYPENGYLSKKKLEKDPWAADYYYVCEDGQNYSLSSNGPDGKPGTDDDIKSE